MTDTVSTPATPLAAWVEPEIRTLDIGETALAPMVGGDGNPRHADCTRS